MFSLGRSKIKQTLLIGIMSKFLIMNITSTKGLFLKWSTLKSKIMV